MEKIEYQINAVEDEIERALQRHEQEQKVKDESNCFMMVLMQKKDWQTGLRFLLPMELR